MKLTVAKRTRSICRVLLILMIFSLFVTGCGQNIDTNPDNDGGDPNANVGTVLENGFKPSNSAADAPANYCAYKSDTDEFNIDDVTLEFFFGGHYASGVEHELSHSRNYPTFELYFVDEEGNRYFVKRIEENFVSDKYSCEVVYDENWYITEIRYNHSEQITIPSEVFTKENGQIWFEIHSANANDIEPEMQCITGISIFYRVSNGKVVLSNQ